jgi:hypothetical protein
MTRKDISGNDEVESLSHQWSRTLLEKQFERDFEHGRYKNIFSETSDEDKIQQGLAEIHLLDSQLRVKGRRARNINKELESGVEDEKSSKEAQDVTFMTRQETKSGVTTPAKYSQYDDDGDEISNQGTPSESDQLLHQPTASSKSSLSENDELQLQRILHEDFDAFISQSEYDRHKDRLREIDSKLESYHRMERLDADALEREIMKKNSIPTRPGSARRGKLKNDQTRNYLLEKVLFHCLFTASRHCLSVAQRKSIQRL